MKIEPSVEALGDVFGCEAHVVSKHAKLGVLQYSFEYEDEDSRVSMELFPVAGEVYISLFVDKPLFVRLRLDNVHRVVVAIDEEDAEEVRQIEIHFADELIQPLHLSVQPSILLTWAQSV
jgi:hypothetical protein